MSHVNKPISGGNIAFIKKTFSIIPRNLSFFIVAFGTNIISCEGRVEASCVAWLEETCVSQALVLTSYYHTIYLLIDTVHHILVIGNMLNKWLFHLFIVLQ